MLMDLGQRHKPPVEEDAAGPTERWEAATLTTLVLETPSSPKISDIFSAADQHLRMHGHRHLNRITKEYDEARLRFKSKNVLDCDR